MNRFREGRKWRIYVAPHELSIPMDLAVNCTLPDKIWNWLAFKVTAIKLRQTSVDVPTVFAATCRYVLEEWTWEESP